TYYINELDPLGDFTKYCFKNENQVKSKDTKHSQNNPLLPEQSTFEPVHNKGRPQHLDGYLCCYTLWPRFYPHHKTQSAPIVPAKYSFRFEPIGYVLLGYYKPCVLQHIYTSLSLI